MNELVNIKFILQWWILGPGLNAIQKKKRQSNATINKIIKINSPCKTLYLEIKKFIDNNF